MCLMRRISPTRARTRVSCERWLVPGKGSRLDHDPYFVKSISGGGGYLDRTSVFISQRNKTSCADFETISAPCVSQHLKGMRFTSDLLTFRLFTEHITHAVSSTLFLKSCERQSGPAASSRSRLWCTPAVYSICSLFEKKGKVSDGVIVGSNG